LTEIAVKAATERTRTAETNLKKHRSRRSSGRPVLQDISNGRITNAQDPTPLSGVPQLGELPQKLDAERLYRIGAGATMFEVKDPDPYAVDNGRVLGVRIEICSAGTLCFLSLFSHFIRYTKLYMMLYMYLLLQSLLKIQAMRQLYTFSDKQFRFPLSCPQYHTLTKHWLTVTRHFSNTLLYPSQPTSSNQQLVAHSSTHDPTHNPAWSISCKIPACPLDLIFLHRVFQRRKQSKTEPGPPRAGSEARIGNIPQACGYY
jgi:Cenp-O kinetochore centromere component